LPKLIEALGLFDSMNDSGKELIDESYNIRLKVNIYFLNELIF